METLQRTANRGSISTGFDIDNSLKFESDNSERMSFTPASAVASERRKHTISFWIKRTELGSTQYIYEWGGSEGDYLRNFLRFQSDDTLRYATSYNTIINTTRVFRDTSAWYHIVIQTDTVQSSNSDTKFWMYVNGELEGSSTAFNVNDTMAFANNSQHDIGFTSVDNGAYGNYYLAEFNAVGGLKLAPTEFGEYDEDSGIWKPKAYEGTYGTNGFYLDFESSGSLGADSSGNSNNFTLTNITSADQAVDTPTNSFCTFNPLMTQNNPPTISEGAMKSTGGGGTWNQTWGNIGVKNGKWYYEFKVANSASTGYFGASTTPAEGSNTTGASLMYNTSFMVGGAARIDYSYFQNGSQVANESTGWGTISTNDVIGIALDLDSATKTFTVYKNGTALSGTLSQPVALPTNMQDEFIFPLYVQYENRQDEANFGGYTISSISTPASDENGYGTFEYAPPSGYYALCTKNLAEYG